MGPVAEGRAYDEAVLSRARGCLLGQLAGDSLGSLVEFQTAEEIARRYPDGGPSELEDGGVFNTLAGQPTDDSELALALARTLVDAGRYDTRRAIEAYVGWLGSHPFDCGMAVGQALRAASAALRRGEDPVRAARRGAKPKTQANGALMRISPVGILGWLREPEEVAEWAREDASLTHPHPVTQDANALFGVVLARAVALGPGPEDLYAFALDWGRAAGLHRDVLGWLADAAEGPPQDSTHQAGWVRKAFQNAFFRLLHSASLEQGVIDTVRCGGDTDTNACIAGALLGVVQGEEAIPAQWRERVTSCRPAAGEPNVHHPRPKDYWPTDAVELAAQLVELGAG